MPWSRLVARLAPLYPKGERGRPPIPLERMLRVYFVQQWYGLSDEGLEEALYDSQALRGFAGIDLNRDPVPDATTLLKFRHWLERHDLTKVLFEEVGAAAYEAHPYGNPTIGWMTDIQNLTRPEAIAFRREEVVGVEEVILACFGRGVAVLRRLGEPQLERHAARFVTQLDAHRQQTTQRQVRFEELLALFVGQQRRHANLSPSGVSGLCRGRHRGQGNYWFDSEERARASGRRQ